MGRDRIKETVEPDQKVTFKARSRCEKSILIGLNWILYNANEWNKKINARIKRYFSVYIHVHVFTHVCLSNKSGREKYKLKLLKSWYGYHAWDRELKRVIAKRQAAQHAKFTADIHGEWKRYKPHRHRIYTPKQACKDSLLTRIKVGVFWLACIDLGWMEGSEHLE